MTQHIKRFVLDDSLISLWSAQILLIYFGLIGLRLAKVYIPGWLWLLPLLLPVGALVVERISTRLLYRQVYNALGYFLVALTLSAASWAILMLDRGSEFKGQANLIVPGVLVPFGVTIIGIEVRLHQRTQTPWGPGGRLNASSGVLDPNGSTSDITRTENPQSLIAILLLLPWVVLLARLVARSAPEQARLALLALCLLLLAAYGVWGAGLHLARSVAVWYWEIRHDKRIQLKR